MNRLLTKDKLKHVVVSAIIAVELNLFLPWWVAGVITLAISLGKELYDRYSGNGQAEWGDLIADLLGLVAGWMVVCIINII